MLQTRVTPDGRVIVITIQGRFDLNTYQELHRIFSTTDAPETSYVIDFTETTSIHDSGYLILVSLIQRLGPQRLRLRNLVRQEEAAATS